MYVLFGLNIEISGKLLGMTWRIPVAVIPLLCTSLDLEAADLCAKKEANVLYTRTASGSVGIYFISNPAFLIHILAWLP